MATVMSLKPRALWSMGLQRVGHDWATEQQQMSVNRRMVKEDVVYTHTHTHTNAILLSHKKEWNRAICRNMDGPKDCHRE